jgi:hypothetical protein
MIRAVGVGFVMLALVIAVQSEALGGKAVKNQMVKGVIKTVDPSKDLLIVKQKVKSEFVDRELSILDTTKFVVIKGKDKKEVIGKDGLRLLEGHEGASVQVKCDKDVNVLAVTVKLKK